MSRPSILTSIALLVTVGCTSGTWQEPILRGTSKRSAIKTPSQAMTPLVAGAARPAGSSAAASATTDEPLKTETDVTELEIEAPTSLDEALDQVIDDLNSDGHVVKGQSNIARPKTAPVAGSLPKEVPGPVAKSAAPKTRQPPRIALFNKSDTLKSDVKSVTAPNTKSTTPPSSGRVNPLRSEPRQFR